MEIGNSKTVAEREDRGTLMHVRDENGELQYDGEGDSKKPVTLRVAGTYSSIFKKARERQRDKNLKAKRNVFGADLLGRQELEVIAACVLADDFGPFTSNGKNFDYSKENVILLLEAAPWIREQVEETMGDHQGFSTAR